MTTCFSFSGRQFTSFKRGALFWVISKGYFTIILSVRNLRRDANDALKKLDLPEDEEKGYLDDVQKLTDKYIAKIEDIADAKSKELMNI